MEKYKEWRNLSSYFRIRLTRISEQILASCIQTTAYSLTSMENIREEGIVASDAFTKIKEAYSSSLEKNNIRSDRPRCEYHTYEWCMQQFNMYHKSPIRNIHTYLQNAKIQRFFCR